jgi:hypothetical protein
VGRANWREIILGEYFNNIIPVLFSINGAWVQTQGHLQGKLTLYN